MEPGVKNCSLAIAFSRVGVMGAVWPLRRLVVELERSLVELMRWLNLNGGLRRRSLAGNSLKEMVLGKNLPSCEQVLYRED
jgi:hypothetical protein